jgi:glycerate-2-kinase
MKWWLKMSKELVEKIYFKALDSIKAQNIVKNNINIDKKYLTVVDKKIELNSFKNLYIFSVGKAGYDMAKACEDILKENIKGGIAVSLKK